MQIVSPTPEGIAEAVAIIRAGGVVAHATETCYGLACDLTNPAAVLKLFRIKDRSHEQPVSALFSSVDEAKRYVEWSAEAEALARDLPGPLTLVLPLRGDAPHRLFATPNGSQTLGVRVSPHPVALSLVTAFGFPLSTTSANVHGLPSPYSSREIIEQFSRRSAGPDLLIESGILPPNPPSRVMDLSQGSRATILR